MRIVVTANGSGLNVPASPVFGRCPAYVFVDTESMQVEAAENPAIAASGGAGIQAAQFVIERGAQAVVTGNVGPNAFDVFQSAGVPVYLFGGGTVREAVEAYEAGRLEAVSGANAQAGGGMGRGARSAFSSSSPVSPSLTREEEIATLKETIGGLREQLAEVMEKLDGLTAD